MTDQPKPLRGFQLLTPERRREIAAKGGAVKGVKGYAAMSAEVRAEIQPKGNEIRWKLHREKKTLTAGE